MAGPLREQALPLLAAANNHGDLSVKLSSLKQARGVLLSADPSLTAEFLPYLVELQSSPESLVRKALVESIEDVGLKATENLSILFPVILTFLTDNDTVVVRQSIISGTHIFSVVLEELSSQFNRRGIVEIWLEELWSWMVKFKDAVFGILFEAGPVGIKLLALKFVETYILSFTSDNNDSKNFTAEASIRNGRRVFNVSWVVSSHPVLDPHALISEANRYFGVLLDMLQSSSSLPGSLTISVVNCLASIARKRSIYYSSVLSTLLDFDPKVEMARGVHTASIKYSLRTAFLGFLRSTLPAIAESREKLLRALRAMNAGDAAEQAIRQVEKMIRNNGRTLRDARFSKDDQSSGHSPMAGDLMKKRSLPFDNDEAGNRFEVGSKMIRYDPNIDAGPPVHISNSGQDNPANGIAPKVPVLDTELNPVEQMIAMIGALIGEGKRGADSLEILISNIHPDLLADIVITNMRNLPKYLPSSPGLASLSVTRQSDSSSDPTRTVTSVGPSVAVNASIPTTQVSLPVSNAASVSPYDVPSSVNLPADSKRDPRRDPRRLDPRRVLSPAGTPPATTVEDNMNSVQSFQSDFDDPLNKPLAASVNINDENTSLPIVPKTQTELNIVENPVVSVTDQQYSKEDVALDEANELGPDLEVNGASVTVHSPVDELDQDSTLEKSTNVMETDVPYFSYLSETDELSPDVSNITVIEELSPDLPLLPSYVDLTEDQQRCMRNLAVERIIASYKQLKVTETKQTHMILLSRLIAESSADDDMVMIIQKNIVSDYKHHKGHELVMHVLYYLHTLMVSDSVEHCSFAGDVYENFLLGVAKDLLDSLPATDKSFSRLLGEVPCLPDSVLKLLHDICYSDNHYGKDARDGDRVTQGLGAVWSLILSRPLNRQAFLDIALKCAVHSQDDIRAKAIRLVANKLFVLNYISENIEQFAKAMFISAVDQRASDIELLHSGNTVQRTEREIGSQETSISGSQNSEPGVSEGDFLKDTQTGLQGDSSVSFSQAQRLISLFFALCTKKPGLLQLVFDSYGCASKAVKQAINRHIPILIRALGGSYHEVFCIISDPPQGSEDLLTQVVQILSEGTTPSDDLVATVKHLYATKLKDATILIPILFSFSKKEVLPIFPRLVDLPLDKFQIALAHILQGSAHTGPALTPAEVLVAIHDINPEKDGLPLKKITDACSACFEQRTVFTHQVLAKALNQMVDQTPLPLLFMRTIIQAIDAFPTLVDFVMEILSKLVSRQVWRMPKLWVGFLKCVSQTQPHSFHVMLQLPSPQLESALNKYPNLRGPLASYANQPSVKVSLHRSTVILLGLAKESNMQQPHRSSSLHASDASSSIHGAAFT